MKNDVLFWALIPFNLIALTFILILLSSSNLFIFLILFMIAMITFVSYKFKDYKVDATIQKGEKKELKRLKKLVGKCLNSVELIKKSSKTEGLSI